METRVILMFLMVD